MALMSLNFDGFMLAEVMDNVDPLMEGRIKVHIPSLMYNNDLGEKPKTKEVTSLNSNFILNDYSADSITKSNFMWMRPLNKVDCNAESWVISDKFLPNGGTYSVPRIGSKILVFFLDGDPQKGYWFPFSITVEGDKIRIKESDKPSKNWENPVKKPNIDVLRAYYNGNRIEFDNNEKESFRIISTDAEFNFGYRYAKLELEDKCMWEFKDGTYKVITKRQDYIEINKDGFIEIKTKEGHNILLDDEPKKIGKNGFLQFTANNGTGFTIDLTSNKMTINSTGLLDIKANKINITSKDDINIKANGTFNVDATYYKFVD